LGKNIRIGVSESSMKQMTKNILNLSSPKTDKYLPDIVTVTSGKGGVGKTNISVNLAIILKQLKRNVLLIDADINLGNVNLILGIRPKYTIADALVGNIELENIIVSGPQGIDILPAASAVQDLLGMEDDIIKKLGDAFSRFEHEYDIIVVDTGSGISRNVMSFVLGSDKTIVIVTPDPASITDAYSMIKVIRRYEASIPVMLIVNMVGSEDEGESLYKKMNLMVQRFLKSNILYGGSILQDSFVSDSIRKQSPLVLEYPNSVSVNTLKMIIRKLLRLPRTDINKRKSLFNRLMYSRTIIIGED